MEDLTIEKYTNFQDSFLKIFLKNTGLSMKTNSTINYLTELLIYFFLADQ